MTVDDIVKLMLAAAVSFAIAGIAWQIMRFISKSTDTLQDFRRSVQNMSKASDMLLEDYEKVRGLLDTVLTAIRSFQSNILDPLKALGWVAQKFKDNKSDSAEVE